MVISIIHGGANQIVHGRIQNDKLAHCRLFHIDHFRDQHPRITDDQTAGLENDLTAKIADRLRSEEPTSELQSLMRISYAVFSLKKTHPPQTICHHAPTT